MKTRLLVFLSFFCFQATQAQKAIALQHNGISSFFADLQPALDAAVNGDTIYLPGRSFMNLTINKKLAIFGVGHHPDSTSATAKTIINSNIIINSGASNSIISGLQVIYSIDIYSTSYITVQRCSIQGGVFCYGAVAGLNVSESVIGLNGSGNSIFGSPPITSLFSNNIFLGYILSIQSSGVRNNVFLTNSFNGNDCLVDNNISNGSWSGTNNIFHNNINIGVNSTDNYGNQGSGNILGVDFNTLFVNWATPWDYADDFHLTNPTYNTGGTDGTPIGIYGGIFPWKAGSVPFNPHINLKVVAPSTNSSGNLPVQIRAAAQDH